MFKEVYDKIENVTQKLEYINRIFWTFYITGKKEIALSKNLIHICI